MNSYERFLAAMRGETPDRVPVACWLGMPLVMQLIPGPKTYTDMFRLMIEDPLPSIVALQERLGLDPMVLTQQLHPGEVITYPDLLFSWPRKRHAIGRRAARWSDAKRITR